MSNFEAVVTDVRRDLAEAATVPARELVPTRRAEELRLRSLGVEGAAAELLLKQGAAARHEARVEATMEAALAWVKERGIDDPEQGAALLIAIDMHRAGGHSGAGGHGGGSQRLLRGLGKGRWQATDGGAYEAAAMEAVWRLLDKAWPSRREFHHVWPEAAIFNTLPPAWRIAVAADALIEWQLGRDQVDPGWGEVEEDEQPDRVVRLYQPRTQTGLGGPTLLAQGTMAEWAKAYNAAKAQGDEEVRRALQGGKEEPEGSA